MPKTPDDRKTVVIASESFYPVISGVSVMTERLARHLTLEGYRVEVITPSRNRSRYTEERNGYTIHRIPSWPLPWRKGFRFTVLPYISITKILDKIKPDIVHIHDPAFASWVVAKYAYRRDIPVIVTHHFVFEMILAYLPGLEPFHEQIRTLLEKTSFQLYSYCDLLTVPTQTIYELMPLEQLTIPVRVVSNGVEYKRFSVPLDTEPARKLYNIPSDLPILTYVGRMDPEKNVETLLNVFAEMKKQGTTFHGLMLGNGRDRDILMGYAEKQGLKNDLTWIAKVENQSSVLNQLFQLSQVFCIPSPIETESIVTMEAMATGLPVVACNRNALTELVANGETGYLVEPEDLDTWVKRISELTTDKDRAKMMGARGQEFIKSRDLPKTLGVFSELYRTLLDSR